MSQQPDWRAAASDRREAARRKREADAVVTTLRSWWDERFDRPMPPIEVTGERQAPDSEVVRGRGTAPDTVTPTERGDDAVAALLARLSGDVLRFVFREGSHVVAWELDRDLFQARWRDFVTEDGGLCAVADSAGRVGGWLERDTDFSAETSRQDTLLVWSAG